MIYDIIGGYHSPGGKKMKKNLKKMQFFVFFSKGKIFIYIGQGKMLANPKQSPTNSLPTPISGMGGEGAFRLAWRKQRRENQKLT